MTYTVKISFLTAPIQRHLVQVSFSVILVAVSFSKDPFEDSLLRYLFCGPMFEVSVFLLEVLLLRYRSQSILVKVFLSKYPFRSHLVKVSLLRYAFRKLLIEVSIFIAESRSRYSFESSLVEVSFSTYSYRNIFLEELF